MTKNREYLKIGLLLLPGLGLICFFIGTVITMAVTQSFGFFNFAGESGFTTQFWSEQLHSRQFWRAFLYSLRIAGFSAILSVLAAYPIALWLRTPFKGSVTISALMKIPMLIHGLIAAFLYVNLIAYHGFINEILGPDRHHSRAPEDAERPLWNRRTDPSGMEADALRPAPSLGGGQRASATTSIHAAQDLGARSFDRFLKVIAPLTLKSLQAAMIIIFIGAAGDFSFQVIAGPTHVNSMAQYMVRVQNQIGDWNGAAVIAVMLMLLSLFGSLLLALIVQILIKRGMKK